MTIVVVLPTYNERGNIGKMIDTLYRDVFPQIRNHTMKLLVVDDFSPDGTGNVVSKKMKKFKNLFLLEESKIGLGRAYMRGFRYAIDKLKADAVFEMDADFQHDPSDIPRFIEELDRGYDYILGSRFIRGGSIPKNWALKRVFLSKCGNIFIRVILGLWNIHDATTGFRLLRVKNFLERINTLHFQSNSYAYKIQLLYEMNRLGAKIKEIPIQFKTREKGWSKMDSEDFLESLKVVLGLRLKTILPI